MSQKAPALIVSLTPTIENPTHSKHTQTRRSTSKGSSGGARGRTSSSSAAAASAAVGFDPIKARKAEGVVVGRDVKLRRRDEIDPHVLTAA